MSIYPNYLRMPCFNGMSSAECKFKNSCNSGAITQLFKFDSTQTHYVKPSASSSSLGMRTEKTVVMMAGGTGGHVIPALTVADILEKQGVAIQWLGTANRIESRLVPQAGYSLNCIDITALRGQHRLSLLLAPWRLLRAVWQCVKLFRRLRPSLVFGFGGFACGPGAVAAKLCGIPLYIHEQNAIVGLTNRLSSYLATRVFQAYEGAFKNRKTLTVGNPVRRALLLNSAGYQQRAKQVKSRGLNLLVLGGSQGAKAINQVVVELLQNWHHHEKLEIWHQTGNAFNRKQVESHIEYASQVRWHCDTFIDDMSAAYDWADVVLCRAGALTVAELAAVGLPSILVPFPFAVDDHQTANAQALVLAKAAILISEDQLKVDQLMRQLYQWLSVPEQLDVMSKSALSLAKPDAGDRLAQCVLEAIDDA